MTSTALRASQLSRVNFRGEIFRDGGNYRDAVVAHLQSGAAERELSDSEPSANDQEHQSDAENQTSHRGSVAKAVHDAQGNDRESRKNERH